MFVEGFLSQTFKKIAVMLKIFRKLLSVLTCRKYLKFSQKNMSTLVEMRLSFGPRTAGKTMKT